jgi:hypothetical protein
MSVTVVSLFGLCRILWRRYLAVDKPAIPPPRISILLCPSPDDDDDDNGATNYFLCDLGVTLTASISLFNDMDWTR